MLNKTNRFGSNWILRQGAIKETERPFKTPTVRNSRKLQSRTYSSTLSQTRSTFLGRRLLDPTDEGFRTYPLKRFGGRTGVSISLMRNTNLSRHSVKILGSKKGSSFRMAMNFIRGQRISKGIPLICFAMSEAKKRSSRRVPGSSKRHCFSRLDNPSKSSFVLRNRRNFCLRKGVSTIQDVTPETFLDGVLDLHLRVLRGPLDGNLPTSRRDVCT